MPESYYRTGQVAKQLGVSSYHVRRLCEAGEIAAEITNGQQWKIPASEVARLRREGLPEIPLELKDEDAQFRDTPDARTRPPNDVPEGLLAAPSAEVIGAAEEVKVAESRLQKRRIEKEAEEVEDWFRDRERRQADLAAAERQRAEQAEAEHLRRRWLDSWIRYALRSRPHDAPQETELEIHEAVVAVLALVQPDQSRHTTQRLVEAAVEKVLGPWKRKREIRGASESAVNTLHPDVIYRAEWAPLKQRALEAAAAAISRLPADSTKTEMEAVTTVAVQLMAKEYAHFMSCRNLAAWIALSGGTVEEDRAAREAVFEALARLPVGTAQKELERTKEAALEPFRAAIQKRKTEEQRREVQACQERDEARKRTEVETRVDWRLPGRVGTYLAELDGNEIEFDDLSDLRKMEINLENRIRPILIGEVLGDPEISDGDLDALIEELIDAHLGEFLDD